MYNTKFPEAIEIQTIDKCNSNCLICPYGSTEHSGEKIGDDLFTRLLIECSKQKSKLRLIPYLNNEPFIDKSIVKKIKLINQLCPQADVEISTNLSLIDIKKQAELETLKITDFLISVFAFSPETYKKIMPGLSWIKTLSNLKSLTNNVKLKKQIQKISLIMIEHPLVPKNEYRLARIFAEKNGIHFYKWGFLDRADNVKTFSNYINHTRISKCLQNRPLTRLHVYANGDCILCCQDWQRECVLGNVKQNTILEIWNSDRYKKIRESIYNKSEKGPGICLRCKLGK